MTNTIELTFWGADGEEMTVEVPSKWGICESCDGNGRHDHPAFANGISGEEWANEWDVEEREAYMSGAYDVRCEEDCDNGKVRVPDLSALTEKQRADYEAHLDNERYYALERAAEMRMGC